MPTGATPEQIAETDDRAAGIAPFPTLPVAYPPSIRGDVPTEPQWDSGPIVHSVIIPAADLPAVVGLVTVTNRYIALPFTATAIRVVVGGTTAAIGIGWGRAVGANDYDDVAGYIIEGITLRTPPTQALYVANVTANAMTLPSLVIAYRHRGEPG